MEAHDSNKHVRSGFIEKFSEGEVLYRDELALVLKPLALFCKIPVGLHRCNILQTAILFPKLFCKWLANPTNVFGRLSHTTDTFFVPPLCYFTK